MIMSQFTVNRRFDWPCSSLSFAFGSSGLRHGYRLGKFRILKPSPPRLPAKSSGFHVLHQQRTGPKFFAERFMQVFEDMQASVKPDQIHQFEWSHGMIEAELDSFVDVFSAGDAFLEHVESFIADHRVDTAGDEAGRFFNDDNFLAHAFADFDDGGQRVIIGFERAYDFEQLHLMHGIEKVHADTLLGAIGNACDLGDAERGSIRSENGCRTADLVEHGEDFDLRFHLFRDGLDDEIGVARGLIDGTGILQPGKSCVGVRGIDLAEFDGFVEIGADFRLRLAQGVWQKVFENGAIAAESGSMRDAPAHDAGADYGYRANVSADVSPDFGHYLPACSFSFSLPANSRC